MASYQWPPTASSGVTTLDGISGAITLVAGTGITITPSGQNITIASTDLAAAITSINADTTAAQLLTVGTSGIDFAITNPGSGSHVFNLPDASASARGVVTTGTQTFAGAKTFGALSASTFNGNQILIGSGVLDLATFALHATAAASVGGTNTGDVGLGTANGLILTGQTLSLGLASAGVTGALSGTDWSTFNSKGAGSVTSVAVSGGTTGLTTSGGPITSSGTITLAGTLAVANGGTGATTIAGLAAQFTPPNIQTLTGSGNYTTPAGALYLIIRQVGGGGGGGATGSSGAVAGSNGSDTSFGAIISKGGAGGPSQGSFAGGVGGTGGSGGYFNVSGQSGQSGTSINTTPGGFGGNSYFSGGGCNSTTGAGGENAKTNSGSGGQGGGPLALGSAGGGGAGEYREALIIPTASQVFAFVVGPAGGGAGAGVGGSPGGSGANGTLIVEAHFT